MIWAIKKGEKVQAQKGLNGFCPICKEKLIPKCGDIKIWHWAHKSIEDCDSWHEPESAWHLSWKNKFPKQNQEVVIENHRADIKTNRGLVIELQNSSISGIEITKREQFYGNIIWILNGKNLSETFHIKRNKKGYWTFRWKHPRKSWWFSKAEIYIDFTEKIEYNNKMIKYYKKGNRKVVSISEEEYNEYTDQTYYTSHNQDITNIEIERLERENKQLLEFGTIFKIRKMYGKIPCAGWGYLKNKEDLIKWLKKQ